MRSALALTVFAGLVLAGCGGASPQDSAPEETSYSFVTPGQEVEGEVLGRYRTPDQMKAVLLASPEFKDFRCAPTSRTDAFGGSFTQCAEPGKDNSFVRLETYDDPQVAEAVSAGLEENSWVVYAESSAAVAASTNPELVKKAVGVLSR